MKQLISQSQAARLRGVTRQRVHQLIKQGRLNPVYPKGESPPYLYLEEVLKLEEGKRGRPRLPESKKSEPNPELEGFEIDEEVLWQHLPRTAHGFKVMIPAWVERLGKARVLIRFLDAVDEETTMWVKPEELLKLQKSRKRLTAIG